MKASRRLIALDMLRAFAVLLVLGRHLHPLDFWLPDALQQVSRRWANCGWLGVDLFFVLSGFLVSGLLFQEYQRHGKIRVGRFLVRRAFKIYPPFYVFIAIVIYIQYSNYNYDLIKPKQILAEAFFVQNYFPGLLDHTWSLAVEEHFYLMLPITLLIFIAIEKRAANPFRRLPVFCGWVAGILLIARILTHYYGKYEDRHNLMPTHLRIDSLLCGVLLSYYYHFYSEQTLAIARRFRWPIIAAAVVLLIPVYGHVPWDFFNHTYGFTYAYVGFALLLLIALTLPIPQTGLVSLPFRAVAFCGTYSYGIYLWHMPVKLWGAMYLTRWFGWTISPGQELLIYVLGSFVVGIVFSMIIEVPFLALRDWWFPSKSGAVEPSERGAEILPSRGVSPMLAAIKSDNR
jgi:peptidoglycan/LPS O-acetylase OafA/YrhL